jgi:hypothetical protein
MKGAGALLKTHFMTAFFFLGRLLFIIVSITSFMRRLPRDFPEIEAKKIRILTLFLLPNGGIASKCTLKGRDCGGPPFNPPFTGTK